MSKQHNIIQQINSRWEISAETLKKKLTMTKKMGIRRERLAFRLIVCLIVVLLQLVHGFSPRNSIVTFDGASKHATRISVESAPIIQTQSRVIVSTSSLSASNRIDSSNEFVSTSGSSAMATSSESGTASLNPLEAWCTTHMNVWYDKSLSVKCPFFRRRMTDFLDGADMVMRFLLIRHKSLDLIGPPPGCRSTVKGSKYKDLELAEIMDTIRRDWKPKDMRAVIAQQQQHNKGYYITGKLNTTIYRDDCWFDGPDPDMPVRGVRKYLNAASQLFDKSTSTAELLSLEIGDGSGYTSHKHKRTRATIVARWKLKGVLHLPWHPSLPAWTGSTTYHLDDEHMIYRHEEQWDISVFRAFTQTLWPELGSILWREESTTFDNVKADKCTDMSPMR